jgi:hypothetical protein
LTLGSKLALGAASVAALALLGVAARNVYRALGGADSGLAETPPSEATRPGEPGAGVALTPAEVQAIGTTLGHLDAAERQRALLSGGVDRPWPEKVAERELQACQTAVQERGDLEGGGTPDEVERVCGCVVRSLQAAYPGSPPERRSNRMERRYRESMLEIAATCARRVR